MRATLMLAVALAAAPLAPPLGAQQAAKGDGTDLVVGTAAAAPGQIARGILQVPAGVDAGTEIPVVVVRGTRPGPTVAVVAGLHGTEYASVLAVLRLSRELDPAGLAGAVVLVPLANVASFERMSLRVNPVDGKNLNRVFPGDSAGSQSERIAWYLRTRVVERSDIVIDAHSGDLDESLRRYLFVVLTGRADQDSVTLRLGRATGYDHLIRFRAPRDPAAATMLATAAAVLGRPTITIEAGYAGTAHPEDVGALVTGLRGALAELGMIPPTGAPAGAPVWLEQTVFVTSERGGIFQPAVERGAYVAEGSVLGRVTDYFGERPEEIRAPRAGVVLYVRATPALPAGGQVAFLGALTP